MHLIPVIELSPWDYQTSERPALMGSNMDMPEVRHQFWEFSLQEAGIAAPAPYPRKGSFFIKVASVMEPAMILAMINQMFASASLSIVSSGLADIEETLPAFAGGYVLEAGTHIIEPQCCCGLADLDPWRVLVGTESNDWVQVWIGHPCIYGRRKGEFLEISAITDEMAKPENIIPAFSVSVRSLQSAVSDAEEVVLGFRQRIASTLEGKFGYREKIEVIAKALTATSYRE